MVAAFPQELGPFLMKRKGRVETLFTGMGPRQALKKLHPCLARGRYQLVVSTGFAGGARPGLRVGDLVMATQVIDASSGQHWLPARGLENSLGNLSWGSFVTTQRPVLAPQAKEKLGVRYGAVAVDMETAAVAQVCTRAQVPWVALRAILDPMEVVLRCSSWQQAVGCMALPSRWKEFARFLKEVQVASEQLAKGLESLVFTHQHKGDPASRDFSG